ncbi:hypothetical protein Rsub_05990 [Raphidocelis subcapitata]|uniref:AB hydrolase-1 domain-containing protein n=1 Tax=Raphidocelis subcapitata TaxID=307507 RepID=A0A2V0P061_9CHLO|nr:hypothetical protein Rsub_05990 [Raphidocelis subcapitata]|eukprot:GBF93258.1 hypothetical protein Rsub_05990 [Raphidocelis subcapitata]
MQQRKEEVQTRPGVFQGFWSWRGHRIRYLRAGAAGPALVLVHGFGASADCWRKNLVPLSRGRRVWAVDLLGFGLSDQPDPHLAPPHTVYCFDTWGAQLADFVADRAGGAATLAGNSAGGLAALQAAVLAPRRARGVLLLDCALRRLHPRRTPAAARPLVAALQWALRETPLGRAFFARLATREAVRRVLLEAYGRKDAVTDELVELVLAPGLRPGAAAVWLEAVSDGGGPLPEDLLEQVRVPVAAAWGSEDPWERLEDARRIFGASPRVEAFTELPGCGHCPQDEAPELVNPLIAAFAARCERRGAKRGGAGSAPPRAGGAPPRPAGRGAAAAAAAAAAARAAVPLP